MQLLFISHNPLPETLWGKSFPFEGVTVITANEPTASLLEQVDFCIDFAFEQYPPSIELYKKCGTPVFIASVILTLNELGVKEEPIARFNNWPSFEQRNTLELAATDPALLFFETIFQQYNLLYEKTGDVPGFVSARILAVIINEAYIACGEEVAAPGEIDTAMKLGTNYPNGPFEWAAKIGIKNIYQLLHKLSVTEPRYEPALLLKQKVHEQ